MTCCYLSHIILWIGQGLVGSVSKLDAMLFVTPSQSVARTWNPNHLWPVSGCGPVASYVAGRWLPTAPRRGFRHVPLIPEVGVAASPPGGRSSTRPVIRLTQLELPNWLRPSYCWLEFTAIRVYRKDGGKRKHLGRLSRARVWGIYLSLLFLKWIILFEQIKIKF